MRASSTFFFAVLALVRVALATPPACLIAAMGVQTNPADLKALCGSLEPQVVGNITEKCGTGDAYSSATSIYAATCLASESVTISITKSSSSKASSSTGSVSAKTTSTGTDAKTTATTAGASAAANTGSSSATGTSAAAASTTATKANSAGSTAPQFFLAALAIGMVGLVL